MRKEISESIKKQFAENIKRVEEIKDENQLNMSVIIYSNDKVYYGMTNVKVTLFTNGIKNVMPSPIPNNLLVDTENEMRKRMFDLPYILDKKGNLYLGKIITLREYIELYLNEIRDLMNII